VFAIAVVAMDISEKKDTTHTLLVYILGMALELLVTILESGFGGLVVACWPLVPKFAGSHPAEAVGFLGQKNLQHAFLRRGSKAVGPMS
jgi:hypothetical protein